MPQQMRGCVAGRWAGTVERHTLVSFGELLRHYRVAAVLTQEELAARAGLSARAISDLERGVKSHPHPDTVRRLAEALGLESAARTSFDAARRRRTARGGPSGRLSDTGINAAQSGTSPAPFVGRAGELALLEHYLSGEGPLVLLLAGEPGIGKSRLLQAAAARGSRLGWCVLQAGCQRRSGQEPFAPVLGALKAYIQQRTGAALRADLRGCAWLVRLLPELAGLPIEPLPAWTLPPEQERRLMIDAAARFVANVAGPSGTLLILDDLQWAGADALDLLATLMHGAMECPLRVLGAYRDSEVSAHHALSVLLADLAQAGLAQQRRLEPLTPDEARELLGELLAGPAGEGAALRERVVQRTGGVPFFLVSVAQSMRLDPRESSGQDELPWDITHAVRQRVATLPAAGRELLELAAVIGRVIPHALLGRVAARGEGEVLAALEPAYRARLLEQEGPETWRFAHDVIREVIAGDLVAARRTALHRRIAQTLETETDDRAVELLADHYSQGMAPEKAAPYLEQAGDRAWAQHANAAAEGYYRELVATLDNLGRGKDAARAREKLGTVLHIVAHYDAALVALEGAAATYAATGEGEGEGRVTARIGRVHEDRGTPAEGRARLQPLALRLEAQDASPGLVALYACLADILWACGRYREERATAERAVALARRVGDARSLAEALWEDGLAHLAAGHLANARDALEEAVPCAEAVGALDLIIEPLLLLGVVYLRYGQLDRSTQQCTRALAVAEQVGFTTYRTAATARLSILAYVRGDWAEARRHGEQAFTLSRQIGSSWISPRPLTALGLLCFGEGQWEVARRYLEESVAVGTRVGQQISEPFAPSVLAECDILEGHPERAERRLSALRASLGSGDGDVALLLGPLAWAQLERGDVTAAAATVEQAMTQARAHDDRLTLVDILRVHALVALRQERWTEAAQALDEGVALARALPYPYAEARLWQVYGALHLQQGERGPGRARLREALVLFRQLGAHKDIAAVEQALARRAAG